MSTSESPCRNCGRPFLRDDLDRQRWCADCRARVVGRATIVGRIAGLLASVGTIVGIAMIVEPSPRFLMAWAVLVAAVYYIVYLLVRRMSFEIIRSRGVPGPKD